MKMFLHLDKRMPCAGTDIKLLNIKLLNISE